MKEDYVREEFEDYIEEIKQKYKEIKDDIQDMIDKADFIKDDIKYIDSILDNISNYKKFTCEKYIECLSDFTRSLYYFQKDSDLKYNIPLLQLIVFVNTFFSSCLCKFRCMFKKD